MKEPISYIIKGYNGIMDLDLTHIPSQFHTEMIHQHRADIKEYKKEQRERPNRLRYENTVSRTNDIWDKYYKCLRKREDKKEIQWMERYKDKQRYISVLESRNMR